MQEKSMLNLETLLTDKNQKSSSEKDGISNEEEKSKDRKSCHPYERWDQKGWELYVLFSLKHLIDYPDEKISFLQRRRNYSRFDKSFAEFFFSIFKTDSEIKEKEVNMMAKKAKSKFNTLKRRFFSNKKYRVPDFPLLMCSNAETIIKSGSSKFTKEFQVAVQEWKKLYHDENYSLGPLSANELVSFPNFCGSNQSMKPNEMNKNQGMNEL